MASVAAQLPTAVLRRGCHSLHAVDEDNLRYPVVLVHGYAGTDGVWSAARRALRDAGFGHIVCLNYNSFSSDPADVAVELSRRALQAMRATQAPGVHLVGHSLGGLLIRRALADNLTLAGSAATVVTIASPHRGAPLARIAPGRCARVIQPVAAAWPHPDPSVRRARWLAYYTDGDRIVPTTSARLDDAGSRAINVLIPRSGHLTICRDPRLIRSLVHELIRTEAAVPSPSCVVAA